MHFQYAFLGNTHFQYALLMAPRFSKHMHFSMRKCIYLYIFWLAAVNAYFLDCPNQRFAELCIFDRSKIFQKYACFHRKMHFFCFSAGCRKRNMKYEICIFCRQPKSKKYTFSDGNMHISEKSWSGQKCIIQRNVDLDNPGSKRLLQPAKKYTNICIFPWKNAYVWKILEPSKVHVENACCPKMHIENAYFPTCQVRVVRFYVSCLLLSSSPPPPAQPRPSTHSVLCRTSTTTIHAQCSLPDLNHDHPRPVFPAGPQPRPSTPSVPCRTSTASIHAKCSLPDLM